MKERELLKTSDAAKFLGVNVHTLRRWDECGKLRSIRTAGGHRRWDLATLRQFAGEEEAPQSTDINVVTYARCSSVE